MPDGIDPTVLGALTLWSGLGWALAWIALRAHLLEAKQPTHCVSCGRLLKDDRRCPCLDSS
jgi:hypothetical protein